jgi:3-phosphoshikimate 1-carboxyvinyltransferase
VLPARLHSHGDHRIAMAAAVLGTAGAPIEIDGAEAVAKSYPAFFDDLESIGGRIAWVSNR